MFEYMTAQEAAERWDISVRRVQRLLNLLMADIKQTKIKTELINYEKNFNY